MRNKLVTIAGIVLLSTCIVTPVYGRSYRDKLREDNTKTRQDVERLKRGYNNFRNWVNGDDPHERAKNIAGSVIDKMYNISGSKKVLDFIDKGPKNYKKGPGAERYNKNRK
ncbi:MAG: hypothetical protein ABIA78_03075 [archaeon]